MHFEQGLKFKHDYLQVHTPTQVVDTPLQRHQSQSYPDRLCPTGCWERFRRIHCSSWVPLTSELREQRDSKQLMQFVSCERKASKQASKQFPRVQLVLSATPDKEWLLIVVLHETLSRNRPSQPSYCVLYHFCYVSVLSKVGKTWLEFWVCQNWNARLTERAILYAGSDEWSCKRHTKGNNNANNCSTVTARTTGNKKTTFLIVLISVQL